jgi:Type VI secretion, TssG/PASTA domain
VTRVENIWGNEAQTPQVQRPLPIMPDLTSGTHAFRHTVDSALASLAAMRISAARIHLRRTGREALPEGTIVAQYPPAGEPLDPDTPVRLDVAGLGFTHALPVGMWDSGGEAEPGTREMLEGIDNPLVKLEHWAHEGAALFRISETDLLACERWMALFGVKSSEWPREIWFRLASLLAQLPTLACSEEGMRLVLQVLFQIPIENLTYQRSLAMLHREKTTLFGERASRLGVDMVLGDAVEDLAHLRITLGPVSLATYEAFAEGERGRLLRRALDYLIPAFQDYEIAWTVEDAGRCPQLGVRERNSRLGVNTHLGKAA